MRRLLFLALPFALACSAEDEPKVKPPPVEKDPVYVAAATQVTTTVQGATGATYFAAPWPDDRRLDSQGFFRTDDFPNPGNAAFFNTVKQRSAKLVKGWGTNTPLYVPFTAALDATKLPRDPDAYRGATAPIYLVAVDESSPEYGQRLPLEFAWFGAKTLFLPGNVLALRPVLGFTLEPKTRYALVVTTRVVDSNGLPVGSDRPFFDAIRTKVATAEADRRYWAPLTAYLAKKGLARDEVAGALLFTTQDTTGELFALGAWVEAQPAPTGSGLKVLVDANGHPRRPGGARAFEGTYEAPNLLHGTPVYESDGGEFVYDEQDLPVPSEQEHLRFALCLPPGDPAGTKIPVVFVSHGTGGSYTTFLEDGTCGTLAAQGIASVGIDNVIHGPRAKGAERCLQGAPEECWFNIANPVSSRNLLRQAALDHLSLRKMAEGLALPASITGLSKDVSLDLEHYGFFGHSQGGLTGALYTAIDARLSASLLSGSGGHITSTILERDNTEGSVGTGGGLTPKDLAELLLFNIAGKERLSQLHPGLAFMQLVGEVADPINYAKSWQRAPLGRRKSVLLINGVDDPYTPKTCAYAYAVRGGVPQLPTGRQDYVGFELAGLLPQTGGDLTGNIPDDGDLPAVTAGFRHFPGQGHFPVFEDSTAIAIWSRFFATNAARGLPTISNR